VVGSVALAVIAASSPKGGTPRTPTTRSRSPPLKLRTGLRRSSSDYDRDPFLRRLAVGQHAREEVKPTYKESTGNDQGTPGEAAA
jgi:hypothetical protein